RAALNPDVEEQLDVAEDNLLVAEQELVPMMLAWQHHIGQELAQDGLQENRKRILESEQERLLGVLPGLRTELAELEKKVGNTEEPEEIDFTAEMEQQLPQLELNVLNQQRQRQQLQAQVNPLRDNDTALNLVQFHLATVVETLAPL